MSNSQDSLYKEWYFEIGKKFRTLNAYQKNFLFMESLADLLHTISADFGETRLILRDFWWYIRKTLRNKIVKLPPQYQYSRRKHCICLLKRAWCHTSSPLRWSSPILQSIPFTMLYLTRVHVVINGNTNTFQQLSPERPSFVCPCVSPCREYIAIRLKSPRGTIVIKVCFICKAHDVWYSKFRMTRRNMLKVNRHWKLSMSDFQSLCCS